MEVLRFSGVRHKKIQRLIVVTSIIKCHVPCHYVRNVSETIVVTQVVNSSASCHYVGNVSETTFTNNLTRMYAGATGFGFTRTKMMA